MSLEYEPSSELLHISAMLLVINPGASGRTRAGVQACNQVLVCDFGFRISVWGFGV